MKSTYSGSIKAHHIQPIKKIGDNCQNHVSRGKGFPSNPLQPSIFKVILGKNATNFSHCILSYTIWAV